MPSRRTNLPAFLKPLFWDLSFEDLDALRHRSLIVARIAEHGTDEAVRWLLSSYPDETIAEALEEMQSRVSRWTMNLWRLWLSKPEDWCARIPSRPLKGAFWRS